MRISDELRRQMTEMGERAYPNEGCGIFLEKDARERGIEVVGFWHTHPDHAAHPSQYDADHAWPEYVYVIMAIHSGKQVDVNAFVLRQEEPPEFGPEPIS